MYFKKIFVSFYEAWKLKFIQKFICPAQNKIDSVKQPITLIQEYEILALKNPNKNYKYFSGYYKNQMIPAPFTHTYIYIYIYAFIDEHIFIYLLVFVSEINKSSIHDKEENQSLYAY